MLAGVPKHLIRNNVQIYIIIDMQLIWPWAWACWTKMSLAYHSLSNLNKFSQYNSTNLKFCYDLLIKTEKEFATYL